MIRFLYKTPEKSGRGEGLGYPEINKGFVWANVTNPTKEEIAAIQQKFSLPESILIRFHNEKSSIRYYLKPLVFTFVDYYLDNDKIKTEDVLYIVGENYIVTISATRLNHYDEEFENLYQKLDDLPLNVGYMLYELLDVDAEENYDVLQITENKVAEIEKNVLSQYFDPEKVREIVQYKRYLLSMWRRWRGNSKMIYMIRKGVTPIKITDTLMISFSQLHDTFVSQMEIVLTQREALTDSISIYESFISNRLATISNKMNFTLKNMTFIMFLWTAIATIISVPNTLATIGFSIGELVASMLSWQKISIVLFVSSIIPVLWFLIYWKKLRVEYGEEIDYLKQRRELVESLERSGYIKDHVVRDAMVKVRRELFVPPERARSAYLDISIPIPGEVVVSSPHLHSIVLSALKLRPGDSVLEIGAGSGVLLAYMKEIVGKQGKAYGIEIIPETHDFCLDNLSRAGYNDVKLFLADGRKGLPDKAPFDRIVISALAREIPQPLFDQLKPGGILVAPVGKSSDKQEIVVFEKTETGKIVKNVITDMRFVPLKGRLGE